MLIPNHYEINVSLNGIHFFATSNRSIMSQQDLDKIYPIIKEKFPEKEGYKISVTKTVCYGEEVDMNNYKED